MTGPTCLRSRAAAFLLLSLLACAPALPPLTGTQTYPDPLRNDLKTRALRAALVEVSRSTNNSGLHYGVYLDTLVGPTPDEFLFEYAHPHDWRDSMVSAKLVDGLFGVPAERSGLPLVAFAITIGEPYPAGNDTVEVVYAWCVRRFPTRNGIVGQPSVWRDAMVRSDTGWVRVRHLPTVMTQACNP